MAIITLGSYNPKVENSQPLPKQKLFHSSPAKFKCYQGGMGAGKTLAGCWEAIFLSLENPTNVGLIARQTFPALRDTTMATFFEICPKELIYNYNQTEHNLTFINGSKILFRSFEGLSAIQEQNKFGSLELGWFYFDEGEEVSENTFLLLIGRLRKTNVNRLTGFITTNPPNIDHWIYRMFVENKDPNYLHIKANTYENKENLPEGYIESLERTYDERWANKYLKGEFGFLTKDLPVYPKFSFSICTREKLNFNPFDVIYRGWDFGYRHPATVFCQKTPQGLLILREIMGKDQHILDYGKEVKEKSEEWFGKDVKFIDIAPLDGTFRSDKSELSSIQYLMRLGIRPRIISLAGITKKSISIIRQLISSNQLLIDKECIRIIEGFSGGYARDAKDDMPIKDNFYDHLQDALNCVVGSIFSIIPSQKEQSKPLISREKEIINDFDREIERIEKEKRVASLENKMWDFNQKIFDDADLI